MFLMAPKKFLNVNKKFFLMCTIHLNNTTQLKNSKKSLTLKFICI